MSENPYADFGTIITEDRFVGRKRELRTVASRIFGERGFGSIAVVGLPRIGKTSLVSEAIMTASSTPKRPVMPRGRQLPPLVLADDQREQLLALSQSTSMPYGLVQRARIILTCAEGLTNAAVAQRLDVSPSAVGKWRRRFLDRGIQGLHDELRPGRPRTYDDEKVAELINHALQEKPDNASAWSVRLMAKAQGVSKSTVQYGEPKHVLSGAAWSWSARTWVSPARWESCSEP